MNRILFISLDQEHVELIRNTYREHSRQYDKITRGRHEFKFSVIVATAFEQLSRADLDVDIVITRGLLSSRIKEACPDIAVVDVPIGSELVTNAYKAIKQFGRQPIAMIGSDNVVYAARGIGEALDADIKTYLQTGNDPSAVGLLLDQVLADGRKIIICGFNTFVEAQRRDCHPILIDMSRESIWQAISEAKHGALNRRKERERAEQFSAVLNHAYEGIIATDMKGNITVFNAAAAGILRVSPRVGKPLDEVIPRGRLNSVFRGSADFTDKVVPYDNELLSVNKVSVLLHGDFSGHIITLQKSSDIQKTEGLIRRQLYAKGHVAKYRLGDVIGSSPAVKAALSDAKKYAGVSSNILIVGETGTGKELFAQGIHNESERRAAPFVAINCAALAKSLLESELFGYVEGAFTGAAKGGKPGIFEIAHTGTIFLDEISEIPLELQGRLLRVLQERQIMRLGGDKVIPIDVRIVSASNKPLLHEVRRNRFRRDLFYRLNVLTLTIPNLNARGADVLVLAAHYLEEYCARFQKPALIISDAACDRLLQHRWEGNVRELRNVCECVAVLNETGIVEAAELDRVLGDPAETPAVTEDVDYARELLQFDKMQILAVLKSCKGDREKASKKLGISKTTLWRRLKSFGVDA